MHRRAAKCGVVEGKECRKQISRPKRWHDKRVGVGIGQFLLWGSDGRVERAPGLILTRLISVPCMGA